MGTIPLLPLAASQTPRLFCPLHHQREGGDPAAPVPVTSACARLIPLPAAFGDALKPRGSRLGSAGGEQGRGSLCAPPRPCTPFPAPTTHPREGVPPGCSPHRAAMGSPGPALHPDHWGKAQSRSGFWEGLGVGVPPPARVPGSPVGWVQALLPPRQGLGLSPAKGRARSGPGDAPYRHVPCWDAPYLGCSGLGERSVPGGCSVPRMLRAGGMLSTRDAPCQ